MDQYDMEIQDLMLNLLDAIKSADKLDAEVLFRIDTSTTHIIAKALKEKNLI